MNPRSATEAARILWNAWTSGVDIEALPAECRPNDLAAGYTIQAQLDELAGARTGWKIAATGAAGRESLGVDHPLAGPMYERSLLDPGGAIATSALRLNMVEAEFGFVIGKGLPAADGPFDRSAVLAAIDTFVPALEIPVTRYVDHRVVGAPQLVADAACAGLFALGTAVADFDPAALPMHAVSLTTSTGTAEGTGANVLGDPMEAVRWLANELASQGRGLRAGDTVVTGAAAAATKLGAGPVKADFGDLGSVEIALV